MAQVQTLNPPLPTKVVHQFPFPTWIENLAIRSNGQILGTLLTTPDLYLIDPTTSPPKATLVYKFPNIPATTGIIELGHDVFSICTGSFDAATTKNTQGSYSVWEVDMSKFDGDGNAEVKKVVDIKDSGLLNGMELLSAEKKEVLIADSEIGCVWKVDVGSGEHEMAIQVDEMKLPAEGLPLGINGIKIRDGYLYWTNSGKALFCRIKIDGAGKAIGGAEVLAEGIVGDDFIFDKEGNAWVCQPAHNTISVLKANGERVLVAGKQDDLEVSGATACQFGRKRGEEHILYISTNGSLVAPVHGTVTEGGKIAAVDTTRFYSQ